MVTTTKEILEVLLYLLVGAKGMTHLTWKQNRWICTM